MEWSRRRIVSQHTLTRVGAKQIFMYFTNGKYSKISGLLVLVHS